MAKRTYEDSDRAACLAALVANGGNVSRTAQQCGVPRPTLISWIRQNAILSNTCSTPSDIKKPAAERAADLLPDAIRMLADRYCNLAATLVGVAESGAKDLSAKDAVVASAVALDKYLLLKGQPTSITRHIAETMSDEQIEREIAAVQERLAASPEPV
jgi:transposase-like protein